MSIFEHIDKKVVIGFGVVLTVLLGTSFYLLSGKTPEESSLTVLSDSPRDAALGRELLTALATLKSTKLNTAIFNDPVFKSLRDFGVVIAAQPVGRRNPFASLSATTSTKNVVGTTKIPLSGSAGASSGGLTGGQVSPSSQPSSPEEFDMNFSF